MLLQGERANWIDPTYRKYFIDLCMREAKNGNIIWGNLEAYYLEHDFSGTENIDGKIYYPETIKKWMGLYEKAVPHTAEINNGNRIWLQFYNSYF